MSQESRGQSGGKPGGRTAIFEASDADNTGQFSSGDWALFLTLPSIWGASFLLIAIGLESLTPGMITFLRAGLGAITLLALRTWRRADTAIDREDLPRIVLLSAIWVAIPFTLFPLAEQHINSAVTGLLNGAMPVVAAIVSTLLVKRVPRRTEALGIAIGSLGILFISLPSFGEGSSQAGGVLMVLAATVCYGFSVNIAAPIQKKYGALTLMTPVLLLASLWTLPFGLWNFGDNHAEIGPLLAVFFLGAIGTGVAYWIMATLVGRVGAVRSSFITYLIPVIALVLGIAFRDDAVAALAIAGAALTILGALLASRK